MLYSTTLVAQIDTVENYFPIKVGTTWVYKIYPEFSNERERITITKDSISLTDSSHYIFINNQTYPFYRVDTLGNVFRFPLGLSSNSNWLIFKQHAQKFESWLMTDTTKDTSSVRAFARIKDIGIDYILNRFIKYKVVEWGSGCPDCPPDSFNFSPRFDYFADGFGWYFAIVEPSATERLLIGFISQGDTLGDVTKVINLKDPLVLSFVLHQNFPNPFNSSTTILYELKTEQLVTIKIFDLLGREVQQLAHQIQTTGEHKINFDANGLETGMYLLQIKAGEQVQVKKLLYLK